MDIFRAKIKVSVALLIGSAILLFSCKSAQSTSETGSSGDMMTQQSENMTLLNTNNGKLASKFKAPLMERYAMAKEPYTEFRKGVYVETYNDSTQRVDGTITANYAIWLEKRDLWEAKGNVIATNSQGQKLETEQLFWDKKGKRIYSNVDTKLSKDDDVAYGTGFVSDENMENIELRDPSWEAVVKEQPKTDSLKVNEPKTVTPKPQTNSSDDVPRIREGEAVAKPKLPDEKPKERNKALPPQVKKYAKPIK